MKSEIHPKYTEAAYKCSCGAELKTRSTVESVSTGVCSACHPFYTGKQSHMSKEGRAEKFKRKYDKKSAEASAALTKH